MLSASTAVTLLRSLRPRTAVTLADGSTGLVMCQTRELVTVLVGSTVRVVERWQCEDEWTEAEREWFARPLTGVVA